jgi:pimeloyl-ACP methyl ester carboxylesterase
MPHLEVEGIRLHYTTHGHDRVGGSPVVLLHGLGSCGDDWLMQVPALTTRYRVITVDLPGHGESGATPKGVTIESMARPVVALLDALDEARAHIVGLSLGGMVALQLAVDHPSRVRSLVLVNTFARLHQPPGGLVRGLVRVGLLVAAPMSWTGRWVAGGLFPGPDQGPIREVAAKRIAANSRRSYLRAVSAILRFDASRWLGEIRAPTLVVAGAQDQTAPLPSKIELATGIEGARIEIVEGSGHATPIDAPETFNSLLLRFLENVG